MKVTKALAVALCSVSLLAVPVGTAAASTSPSIESIDALNLTPMSEAQAAEIRGEALPAALVYAVLAAPTLHALLQTAIVNHFPLMLIRHAWETLRG